MELLLKLWIASIMVLIAITSSGSGSKTGFSGGIKFPEDEVRRWTDEFSYTITNLARNLTALKFLQDKYTNYSNVKPGNGEDIVNKIVYNMEKLLRGKVENIERLVKNAENLYENYTFEPELDYDFLNSKKLLSTSDMSHSQIYSAEEMSQKFRSINLSMAGDFNYLPININTSTVQVPTTVFDKSTQIMNGALWSNKLDSSFIENYRKDELHTWQYFCSTDGFFRVYPGMRWPRDNMESGIDFFDCRVRNWYLQGASGPKNVVILVDISGSMKGLRMIIAQSTVKQILNTLDDDDYFNIIRFSDKVHYVDRCFNDTLSLMAATKDNKRIMMELMEEEVETKNQADIGKAFEEVFNLYDRLQETIKQTYVSLCNKAILLITDGVPEHHARVFQNRNWPDKRTRVFTFLIGREVKDDREVKWMACANKDVLKGASRPKWVKVMGIRRLAIHQLQHMKFVHAGGYYSHISTLADVQENVQNYIKVLSRPMVINRNHVLVWTPVYLDHLSSLDPKKGLKFMTSAALPVFDKKNDTFREGNLLGVMGTDVPMQMLQELAPTHKLGVNAFAFLVNQHGYVLFHPDFKPYRTDPETGEKILNPNFSNMDLKDIILPINHKELNKMRENMLNMNKGSKEVKILRHYDNMRRMVKREYKFYWRAIMNKTFNLGIALPVAFDTVSNAKFLNPIRETLNGSNIQIAPWKYCTNLDRLLKGRARIDKLIELYENETIRQKHCDLRLLNRLTWDSKFTKNLQDVWSQSGRDYKLRGRTTSGRYNTLRKLRSYGIDLIFFGSKGGLTRYIQTKNTGTIPRFLENKTTPIDSYYYKRAVEGTEKLASKEEYTFTFSVPAVDVFNPNTSSVLITAPIVARYEGLKDVAGVVGMQMNYRNFESIYQDSFSKYYKMNCSNERISCYLVDDHGYILSTRYPDGVVGEFFGVIENGLMSELIRRRLFIGYNFTDFQAVCQINADDKSKSSASVLLNPLKALFRGLLWTITEIAFFFSQFSFTHLIQQWRHVTGEELEYEMFPETGGQYLCDYDINDMKPNERLAFAQLSAVDCASKHKVLGYRPCHKKFTLYHVDFNVLMIGPLIGSLQGCESMCPEGFNCSLHFRPACKRAYAVSRIADTNLIHVAVDNDCRCTEQEVDFGLEQKEIIYSYAEQCADRIQNRYTVKKRPCGDYSHIEDDRKCTGCKHSISVSIFLLCLVVFWNFSS